LEGGGCLCGLKKKKINHTHNIQAPPRPHSRFPSRHPRPSPRAPRRPAPPTRVGGYGGCCVCRWMKRGEGGVGGWMDIWMDGCIYMYIICIMLLARFLPPTPESTNHHQLMTCPPPSHPPIPSPETRNPEQRGPRMGAAATRGGARCDHLLGRSEGAMSGTGRGSQGEGR
jgi:hypothetical protein